MTDPYQLYADGGTYLRLGYVHETYDRLSGHDYRASADSDGMPSPQKPRQG